MIKKVIRTKKFEIPESVVVLGNFDGIHKGHMLLIEKALGIEKETGLSTAFFTFEPHPSYVLGKKLPVDLIYMPLEKIKVVEELGIDYYIEFPFNMETAAMDAHDFVEDIICSQLNAKVVVVGTDYRFGTRRAGDVELLQELGEQHGFDVIAIKKLEMDDREVSSTWLREEVREGNMQKAMALAGRPFFIDGTVEHGQALGRTIGFPTANVPTPQGKILPPNGVYASNTIVDGISYRSITNVGYKPTVGSREKIVESYILDFDRMIYDELIEIQFLKFLRKEKKFESMDELKRMIELDMENLYSYFSLATDSQL